MIIAKILLHVSFIFSVNKDISSTQLETYEQDCAMNDPPPSYDAVMSSVMSQNPNVSWSTDSRYDPFPY